MVRRAEFGLCSDRRPARAARDSGSKPLSFCHPITRRPVLSCPRPAKKPSLARANRPVRHVREVVRCTVLCFAGLVRCGAVRCGVLSRSSVEVLLCCRTASWASHLTGSRQKYIPNRQALMLVMVVVSGHQQALSGAISWHGIHPIPSMMAQKPWCPTSIESHRRPAIDRSSWFQVVPCS